MSRDVTTKLHQQYLEAVQEICRPEPLAFRWFCQVLDTALLWDHIIDGDPIDKEGANRAFQALTMDWVFNDWFIRNRASLVPVLNGCMEAWKNNDHPGSDGSYSIYTQLPAALALLIRGPEGSKMLPPIYEMIRTERFQDMRRDHPPFFIVGLPRCRSAWLAAFLTDGDVHCHHEFIRQCSTPNDYVKELFWTRAPIVGDSDPTLPLFYDRIRSALPPHKVVFVLRDSARAKASFVEMLESAGADSTEQAAQWPKLEAALKVMQATCPEALTVQFDRLNDMSEVLRLAEYCTGLPFNSSRFKLFDELKITAIPSKVVANMRILQ